MENMGVWKTYEKTTRKIWNSDSSYERLYNDLRNSGKDWMIAKDYGECEIQLCGEAFPQLGVVPGDIHVYYLNENGILNPQFYIKAESKRDFKTQEMVSYLTFNGTTFEKANISDEFLPEIIDKLCSLYGVESNECVSTLENNKEKFLCFKMNN